MAGHHSPAALQPVGRHARQARVTPVGGGLAYPRSMDLGAFGRIATRFETTLVVAGVLPLAGPLRVDDRQVGTSRQRLRQSARRQPAGVPGYYHWQVFYGDTLLPEGYPARPPTPAPG